MQPNVWAAQESIHTPPHLYSTSPLPPKATVAGAPSHPHPANAAPNGRLHNFPQHVFPPQNLQIPAGVTQDEFNEVLQMMRSPPANVNQPGRSLS
ncbi:hypothetical protein E1B28_003367 [Marasmius oreades]|uniref:Uncharacterized protein n=1 Tax=Marasmius oreades TaxID=181124 RepID=A0A9P7RLF9_9AGAR|nr:uncharacterized protein E1B28_003367 [Marasmius oreades]KAG7085829.1 hypothetical protein E1B28_003367 [Marasmius oreades]